MRNAAGGQEKGIGLVEVLIALLVLSIGFLAAGGMQIRAMNGNQRSYHQSQARLLLDDMMDRMRNNPRGIGAGAYDDRDTASLEGDMPDCRTQGCDPVALATRDLFAWRSGISPAGAVPRLPPSSDGSAASGSIDMSPGGVYTLTLTWEELVDGEPATQSASARFVP